MHMVPELMTVVSGLLHSLKAMFWVFMLQLIILYSAAIVCVELIGQPDPELYPAGSLTPEAIAKESLFLKFNNVFNFGSVPRAMNSLFNMVLLEEWVKFA